MREKTFEIKGLKFRKTARSLTKAQLKLSSMEDLSDADKGEELLFLLKDNKNLTREEFEDFLEDLTDEEYLDALNSPTKSIVKLGEAMEAYSKKQLKQGE